MSSHLTINLYTIFNCTRHFLHRFFITFLSFALLYTWSCACVRARAHSRVYANTHISKVCTVYLCLLNIAQGMTGSTVPFAMAGVWVSAYIGAFGAGSGFAEETAAAASSSSSSNGSSSGSSSKSTRKKSTTEASPSFAHLSSAASPVSWQQQLTPSSKGYGAWLLRCMLFGVYFHATACKICHDWLSGLTVSMMLKLGPTQYVLVREFSVAQRASTQRSFIHF